MSNVFQRVKEKFENSIIIVPIWLASMIGLIISLAAFISDYKSSYKGYMALPTQKVDEWVWVIAMLPQIGMIIFATLFILSEKKSGQTNKTRFNWWYFIIAAFLFLWDFGTDLWFKTHYGTDPLFVWIIAGIESVTIYTIGSEILLTASLGLFIYLTPSAFSHLGYFLSSLSGSDAERR